MLPDRFEEGIVACLELEERGICVSNRYLRSVVGNRRPWVARIIGTCPKYKLERDFVRVFRDYRDASRSGRNGICHYFFLRPGVYDVYEIMNSTRTRRYFGVSRGGVFTEVESGDVYEWANRISSVA